MKIEQRPATVVIENLLPSLSGGRYPIKRVRDEDLIVEADVFKDGHDIIAAVLKWRKLGSEKWFESPMTFLGNDRWTGTCTFWENATYEWTIEAWQDQFRSWQHEFHLKWSAGQRDLGSEILEGAHLVESAAAHAGADPDGARLMELAASIENGTPDEVEQIAHLPELEALMDVWTDRSSATAFDPYQRVTVDRDRALHAAWYEFFPRSAEGKPDSGSTFRDCLPRIDDARAMGFNVIYFPPIHPIGITNRKGRNNSVKCEPGEPGVPYAIGSPAGGHKAIEPSLGTFKDFEWLIGELRKRGMELALDFAINCSPDHPYVKDHPEWFFKRPDGTIKYAENPPKKYEDVYPLNFYNANWRALWEEMTDIILFWAGKKVRIFRVDNPHTKPVAFWEYLIGKVRAKYPDTIFLSEAFTKPKMMQALAKVGFTQSYTYFTWRNTAYELEEYFTELTQTDMREYFRANLWPNTPDILPPILVHGGRPAFLIRGLLAATLSPVYGIYSGFELCENAQFPGKEEYLDSEKYQFKGRDWNAPGNIKDFIGRLNAIRRENRALHEYDNLQFHRSENGQLLCYSKTTTAGDNHLLIVVSMDPYHPQSGFINVPLARFDIAEGELYEVADLLSGERYSWRGSRNYVALEPHTKPAHIFRVRALSY
jgi:starch synthase (maltosyl-transferring)